MIYTRYTPLAFTQHGMAFADWILARRMHAPRTLGRRGALAVGSAGRRTLGPPGGERCQRVPS
jgi:hypothetical protein